MDREYCRCCREPSYIYQILDRDGKEIKCKVHSTYTDNGNNLIKFVLDLNDIQLTDEERYLIAEMIVDKVNYGGSLEKISKYIELFKKISGEKML